MVKRRIMCVLLTVQLLVGLVPAALAAPAETGETVTILFTHDMHSHLLPASDETGKSYGGFARLKTAIDQQKLLHPDALLVDAGDFSMGTLFQTIYADQASELRSLGALGYDAVTFGNHEYDYRAAGLASMLNAAADSGEPLPAIVEANYKPPVEGQEAYDQDAAAVWTAFDRCGVEDYTVIERGGINFAVFGITGEDSDACAPMSGMILEDPIDTARQVVEQIQAEVPEPRVVVCLSHSGTSENKASSEDEKLAEKVDGIDVIVSGHSHTTLEEPIYTNGTYIVSAGEYCKNLGVLTLNREGDNLSQADYQLVPIDDSLAESEAMDAQIESYKDLVEESYLMQFGGLTFDQVLVNNPYSFDSVDDLYAQHRESALGNLIADSYRWAVRQAEGEDGVPVDIALTAAGVIRESLPVGELTASNVFNVSSLGIGADGIPGYPLVSVWITGEDLKNAFEVDASVTSLMPAAQLYVSGMSFTFNPHRMLFNRVTQCAQILEDGSEIPLQDDKLYRVVTGLYCGQMLGAVNEKSFGILSITPRDAQGNEITDLEAYILHDENGNEIKEWYALASYLADMGTVSPEYSSPDGRKTVDDSWSLTHLLSNPNGITLAVLAIVVVLILVVVLLIRRCVRRHRRKRR